MIGGHKTSVSLEDQFWLLAAIGHSQIQNRPLVQAAK